MNAIEFFKMSGAGNDFIIIDNRRRLVDAGRQPRLAAQICRRRLSVGADGLIFIEPSQRADIRWRFYNADGSRAEMCGNGARCAARFAYLQGIAGPDVSIETDAGIIRARVRDDGVRVNMPDPTDLRPDVSIELASGPRLMSSINTGVPHVVLVEDDLDAVDVVGLGREIRRHAAFAPAGTNVNFIRPLAPGEIAIRTYERGVEDETLACGTGSIAAAVVAGVRLDMPLPVRVHTRSGSVLTISFSLRPDGVGEVVMEGDARVIYRGRLGPDARH